MVAGARYEVQKTIRELEPEVLTVRFSVRGKKLVPSEAESADPTEQISAPSRETKSP